MSVNHYENFPVGLLLCCRAVCGKPVHAVYAFARTADDIADEGNAEAVERLRQLDELKAELGPHYTRWEIANSFDAAFVQRSD